MRDPILIRCHCESTAMCDAIFNLDVPTAPEMIITDNASYSDIGSRPAEWCKSTPT